MVKFFSYILIVGLAGNLIHVFSDSLLFPAAVSHALLAMLPVIVFAVLYAPFAVAEIVRAQDGFQAAAPLTQVSYDVLR